MLTKQELRIKALELSCSTADSIANNVNDIITNAYLFYDFLDKDIEFSVKIFNFPQPS